MQMNVPRPGPAPARLRILVAVLALLGSVSSLPAALALTPAPDLAWGACPGALADLATPAAAAGEPGGVECATVSVPLDYDDPDGEQIGIAIIRVPAQVPEQRVGTLVFNPGGPGASGIGWVSVEALVGGLFPAELRDHFDIIGFDPRGIGLSHGVQCDPDIFNRPVSLFPETEEEFAALMTRNRELGESCFELTGPLLYHIDTVSAARDIEAIRLALGGEPLNFLGLSYGTMLGAHYAELYPENIRTMALDGALDHDLSESTMLVAEARAYEAEFNRFVAWCAGDPACALHGQDVAALYDRLLAAAAESPLPAPGCVDGTAHQAPCRPTVTAEDIRRTTQDKLLFRPPIPALGLPGWPGLADDLKLAFDGDGTPFSLRMAGGTVDPGYAQGAIFCLDYPARSDTFDELGALMVLGDVVAPRFKGATTTWTIITGCPNWPAPVVNPPHPADVTGTPPILIINATFDPSTAYPWALALFEQIENSVLLTRVGDGHTTTLLPGKSATRDAISHYLITGETPPPNTVLTD